MNLRPHSLQPNKSLRQDNSLIIPLNSNDLRKKIQNYSFLPNEKIGRGYSSIVYKGQNQITKSPVAIKVIQLKTLKDQNSKRFLQNQLDCLRKLNHQNNLRYINSFITANNCYIVTELYSEGDLSKIQKQKLKFSEAQTFQIFNQFYQGYAHFHSHGFIHRDIKPSNILIQKKPDGKFIYVIADFGFVKYTQECPRDSFNVGTPVYMSPESITSNIYTVKSDIWSMGVMLFQLVYGFLPFQSKNQIELKKQICNKELRLQQIELSTNTFISSQLKSLILSCLRKNPQNRINLVDIPEHQWFKKIIQNDLKTAKLTNQIERKSFFSIQKKQFSLSDEKYGFIGNQAIKRQRSLVGNINIEMNFKSKDQFNKKSTTNLTIQKNQQKARISFLTNASNVQNNKKIIKLNTENSYKTLIQQKTINNGFNENSKNDKMMSFLEQKTRIQGYLKKQISQRSSLLQGMRSIVDIKNNQIQRLSFDIQHKNKNINKNYFKIQQNKKNQLELSTSIQENKCESVEKNRPQFINSPIERPLQLNKDVSQQFLQRYKNVTYEASNTENLDPNLNQRRRISHSSNKKNYPKKNADISPQDFIVQSIHTLRYIYETISIYYEQYENSEDNSEEQQSYAKYNEMTKQMIGFFVVYFHAIKKSVMQKQNVFKLQKWDQFVKTQNFQTYIQVIFKYESKFSSLINRRSNTVQVQNQQTQINHKKTFKNFQLQHYKTLNYQLLCYASQLTNLSKYTSKRSLKSSVGINKEIIIVYNLQKCLDIILVTLKSIDSDKVFLSQINPKKQLDEMNSKQKDPFKMSKIIIQLKKKLIMTQSQNQNRENSENLQSFKQSFLQEKLPTLCE